MTLQQVNRISMLGLAHIGDGVYELLTRTYLCAKGATAVQDMHRKTVAMVNAPAQAAAAEKLLPVRKAHRKQDRQGSAAGKGYAYSLPARAGGE